MRRIANPLLMPIWSAQLATGAKSFERNPILGSPRLNRWGLHAGRVALAHRLAAGRRRRLAGRIDAAARADFDRDGFVIRRDFLPAEHFAALRAEIAACRGALREIAEGDTILRKMALDGATLAHLPALGRLLQSAEWRGLIAYAGASAAAPVVWVQSVLRHAQDGPDDPQTRLHADTFHPTVKAWLFLTDVAADRGAFSYVPGSHRLTPQRLEWERRMSRDAARSPDAEIRQGSPRIDPGELPALGLPPPRILAVPANTLVVADTFGFHARGPCAGASLRVEVWAYGRRSPFVPWASLLPWTEAALGRRSRIAWEWGDLREKAGLGNNRWRARPGISPFDPPTG